MKPWRGKAVRSGCTRNNIRVYRNLGLAVQLLVLVLCSTVAFAANVSITSTIDGGGLRATSANYTMDNSVGGIGGISSAAPDTARNGYIGQLYEVASMVITAAPSSVSELSNAQLSASATLDDTTARRRAAL